MNELIIGIIGMVFILAAFILDEFVRKFNRETIKYNLLNVLGSGMLLYYAFSLKGWPFVVLNLVWMGTALVKLAKILAKKRR